MGRVLSFGYVRGLERGHYGRGGRYALVIHSSLVDYFADKQLQFILPEELVVIINLRVFSLGPRGNEFPLRTGGFRRGVYGRRGRRGGLCEGNETLLESWTFGEHSDAPNLEGKALTRSSQSASLQSVSLPFLYKYRYSLLKDKISISRHSNSL